MGCFETIVALGGLEFCRSQPIQSLWHYPRYGYRRIHALLAREGWSVSRKQVQRIRRKEGLKVRPKPQRITRQGVSTGLPTQAIYRNHVWTWDFIFDRTDKGSTLKRLTILDEYTRRCVAIRVLSDRFDPNRSWPPFGRG
ncbi:MAG: hypothetical protein CME20_23945 [Gemmatimonadetes bacterium]|nr:hypothetical protein [Gemmatimonadota bacterium]